MLFFRPAHLLSAMAASLVLFAATSGFAETPTRPFGSRGQVAIEDIVAVRSNGLGFLGVLGPASSGYGPVPPPALVGLVGYDTTASVVYAGSNVKSTSHTIWVAPSVDVFVADRVSLGFTAGVAHGWGEQENSEGRPMGRGTSLTLGLAGRIGYIFPLGAVSLWPRVGLGFTGSRADTLNPTPGGSERISSIAAGVRLSGGVDLGIIYHPTRNFFFSVTPELSVTHGVGWQSALNTIVHAGQSTRVRFAGTLGMGVLLGT